MQYLLSDSQVKYVTGVHTNNLIQFFILQEPTAYLALQWITQLAEPNQYLLQFLGQNLELFLYCPDKETIRALVNMLHEREALDVNYLVACIGERLALYNMFPSIVSNHIPPDFIAAIAQSDMTAESAIFLLNMSDASNDCTDIIIKAFPYAPPGFNFMRFSTDDLRRAIVEITKADNFAIVSVCQLISELKMDTVPNLEAMVYQDLDSVDILPFLRLYPFIVVRDLEAFLEFVSFNEDAVYYLINTIDTIDDWDCLLAVSFAAPCFADLLFALFKRNSDDRFFWKAIEIHATDEMVSVLTVKIAENQQATFDAMRDLSFKDLVIPGSPPTTDLPISLLQLFEHVPQKDVPHTAENLVFWIESLTEKQQLVQYGSVPFVKNRLGNSWYVYISPSFPKSKRTPELTRKIAGSMKPVDLLQTLSTVGFIPFAVTGIPSMNLQPIHSIASPAVMKYLDPRSTLYYLLLSYLSTYTQNIFVNSVQGAFAYELVIKLADKKRNTLVSLFADEAVVGLTLMDSKSDLQAQLDKYCLKHHLRNSPETILILFQPQVPPPSIFIGRKLYLHAMEGVDNLAYIYSGGKFVKDPRSIETVYATEPPLCVGATYTTNEPNVKHAVYETTSDIISYLVSQFDGMEIADFDLAMFLYERYHSLAGVHSLSGNADFANQFFTRFLSALKDTDDIASFVALAKSTTVDFRPEIVKLCASAPELAYKLLACFEPLDIDSIPMLDITPCADYFADLAVSHPDVRDKLIPKHREWLITLCDSENAASLIAPVTEQEMQVIAARFHSKLPIILAQGTKDPRIYLIVAQLLTDHDELVETIASIDFSSLGVAQIMPLVQSTTPGLLAAGLRLIRQCYATNDHAASEAIITAFISTTDTTVPQVVDIIEEYLECFHNSSRITNTVLTKVIDNLDDDFMFDLCGPLLMTLPSLYAGAIASAFSQIHKLPNVSDQSALNGFKLVLRMMTKTKNAWGEMTFPFLERLNHMAPSFNLTDADIDEMASDIFSSQDGSIQTWLNASNSLLASLQFRILTRLIEKVADDETIHPSMLVFASRYGLDQNYQGETVKTSMETKLAHFSACAKCLRRVIETPLTGPLNASCTYFTNLIDQITIVTSMSSMDCDTALAYSDFLLLVAYVGQNSINQMIIQMQRHPFLTNCPHDVQQVYAHFVCDLFRCGLSDLSSIPSLASPEFKMFFKLFREALSHALKDPDSTWGTIRPFIELIQGLLQSSAAPVIVGNLAQMPEFYQVIRLIPNEPKDVQQLKKLIIVLFNKGFNGWSEHEFIDAFAHRSNITSALSIATILITRVKKGIDSDNFALFSQNLKEVLADIDPSDDKNKLMDLLA